MKPPFFAIFLLLMVLGNFFALFKLFVAPNELISKFPKLTKSSFQVFRFLPVINIIALAGMWFLKPWGAYLTIACAIVVVAFDLYYGIFYHLYVAIPNTLILLFFIIKYWNHFK